jgi:hypothetical protein
MLVKIPKTRWVRDEGISELIEHFDQPDRRGRWDRLTPSEWRVIERELEKCRATFQYAARNYFFIQTKKRQDILFRLWESQELLLEIILGLKAKDRSQRVIIIKARQLGCSTVIEALIAWRSFFFANINSLIVSNTPEHAAYLFSIAQHIYDMLPWWLQPMVSSREFKSSMILDNPDVEDRYSNPGLKSHIWAVGATTKSGVGQGIRLSVFHGSEFTEWDEWKAREIIEEDVPNAMDESGETLAALESTAKGAGNYSHSLWLKAEKLGDKSMWTPVFLPWFFDKSHTISAPITWKPKKDEEEMREKVARDWLRCDNALCRQYRRTVIAGVDYTGTACPTCEGSGTLKTFVLSDNQLAWMEYRRENTDGDEDSLSKLRQEQCATSEEAFTVTGSKLFSDKGVAFAANSVHEVPLASGFIDKTLKFHGMNMNTGKCFLDGCRVDHSYDEGIGLTVYEWPMNGAKYVIGADVSEGIGKDYSVASVIRVTDYADYQVAVFARNDIDPYSFGELLNRIGRFYNEAMIATEINRYDTAENTLRIHLQYPNCYLSKNTNSENFISKRFGWLTSVGTKPRLYNTLRKRLDMRLAYIRDKFTFEELKWFRKDDDSAQAKAAEGFHDDRIMALMIAMYTAHEGDWDENAGIVQIKVPLTLETAPWIFTCRARECGYVWPGASAGEYRRCVKCASMWIEAKSSIEQAAVVGGDFRNDWEVSDDELAASIPDYDDL